jgi:hypothetical protein
MNLPRSLVVVHGIEGLPRHAAIGSHCRSRGRDLEIETDLIPGHAAEVTTHDAKARGHDLIIVGHRATSSSITRWLDSGPRYAPRALPGHGRSLGKSRFYPLRSIGPLRETCRRWSRG